MNESWFYLETTDVEYFMYFHAVLEEECPQTTKGRRETFRANTWSDDHRTLFYSIFGTSFPGLTKRDMPIFRKLSTIVERRFIWQKHCTNVWKGEASFEMSDRINVLRNRHSFDAKRIFLSLRQRFENMLLSHHSNWFLPVNEEEYSDKWSKFETEVSKRIVSVSNRSESAIDERRKEKGSSSSVSKRMKSSRKKKRFLYPTEVNEERFGLRWKHEEYSTNFPHIRRWSMRKEFSGENQSRTMEQGFYWLVYQA